MSVARTDPSAPARPLRVGDALPSFDRSDHQGNAVSTTQLRGRWVVLYFYPKDGTPLCTAQGCAFRDAFESLAAAGAEVIGVSADDDVSHRAFAAKNRLPFRLVSDTDGSLRRLLGVPRTLWLFPGRVTYVIDPAGVVRLVFNSAFTGGKHVQRALAVIRAAASTPDAPTGTR